MSVSLEVKQFCDAKNISIAVAESVTVGNLQALIGSVRGASSFFCGGITAYTIDQKAEILGVDRVHAASVDCVSAQVAAEMAKGAARIFGAHIAVATTGYAEPPDLSNSRMTYAFYAIWDVRKYEANPIRSGRIVHQQMDRVENQCVFAEEVLRELADYLLQNN